MPNISSIKTSAMPMPYTFKVEVPIFGAKIPVGLLDRHNLAANVRIIAIILLLQLIKASVSLFWNKIE